jgi:signal transduction histidine kinase
VEQIPHAFVDYKQTTYCIRTVMHTAMGRLQDGGIVRIGLRHEGDWITLEITDYGPPMTNDEREALLMPFATTQELGGNVGMPLCRVMLEKQGCALEITNPPGGGATFLIHLPAVQEEAP